LLLPVVGRSHDFLPAVHLCQVARQLFDGQRPAGAQRPRKRLPSLGQPQAVHALVQPRTSAGKPASRIGYHGTVHDNHPQQIIGKRPGAATDTCSDWAEGCGSRYWTSNQL
jgi:hypothetical protein